jgi:RND family efflux transporter MFP subunit
MTRLLILALAAALGAFVTTSAASADGVTAVHVEAPRRGAAPTILTAYGEAEAASPSVRALTLAQPGQVAAVFVTAGQAVKRGQSLLRFTTAPASVAAYSQAQTALTLALGQQTHTRQLLAQQLATKDQMAAADKAAADARSALSALARDGAGRGATVLTAPFDGVVASLPVSVGDRPAAGATLATLAPLSGLQVSAGIEPGWRGKVHAGQSVSLEPLGGGPAIAGRVLRVDSVLNPKTRLVDVDIAAPAGGAIAGEAFRAEIAVGAKTGWLVPHGAVRVEDGRAFVFQLAGDKAQRVAVTLLQPGRDDDVVDGPIDAHRPLVTIGAFQLDDGSAVRVER